jgi:WhiB family redox-sensing transcriptional regulator
MTAMTEVNTLAPPTEANPQPWPNRAVDVLANSTLRSLIVLTHNVADGPLTANQQAAALGALQHPGTAPDGTSRNTVAQACRRILEPNGILEAVRVPGYTDRGTTAWRLTEDGRHYAVPAAATFLDWSLHFNSLSLPQTLCPIRGSSAMSRSLVMLEIFGSILDQPQGQSYKEIAENTGVDILAVQAALKTGRSNGTIQRTTKTNPADRQLLIPPPIERLLPKHASAEARAIHSTAAKLHRAEKREVNASDFLDTVLKDYAHLDRDRVWKVMTNNKLTCINFTDVDDYGPSRHYRSRYQISPELLPAIENLVTRNHALRSSLDFIAAARERARAIITNRALAGFLLDKIWPPELDPEIAKNRSTTAHWTARRLGSLTAKAVDWRTRAACLGEDPELFFPIGTLGPSAKQAAEAKAVCDTCIVRQECSDWARASRQDNGILGGMTPNERRQSKGSALELKVRTNNQITISVQQNSKVTTS